MRYAWILGLLTLTAGTAGARPTAIPPVDGTVAYHLSTIMQGEALQAVELTLSFRADASGHTELNLPDQWGGGDHFYDRLKDLKIDGATTVSAPDPAHRLIDAKPGTRLTVSYRLEANRVQGQDLPIETNFTYPAIAPEWFYITGPGLMATVAGRDQTAITFDWDLPKGWTGATNLQYPLTKDMQTDAQEAVFLAGKDVQIATQASPGGDLRIAWRGRFTSFTPAEFNTAVSDIIRTEQGFWGEGQPHFLVPLVPTEGQPGQISIRGSGLGDSFAMTGTPDSDVGLFNVILAHEYFHSWNPVRLGGFDEGAAELTGYWFSEGFTDYYGRKLALQSGAVGPADFMKAWNRALSEYAASPYRTSPNSIVADKFWSDQQVHQLPYQRGAMLAAVLDTRWRAQGKSLDGFMHVLRDQTKADTASGAPHMLLMDRLNRAAAAYGVSFGDLIDRYMVAGEAISLPEDAFGPEFRVTWVDLPQRDLGYDADKSRAAGAFTDVDPEGPAYAAGIREGMKRIKVDSTTNADSAEVITATVAGPDGQPLTFSFNPVGKTRLHTQQLIRPNS